MRPNTVSTSPTKNSVLSIPTLTCAYDRTGETERLEIETIVLVLTFECIIYVTSARFLNFCKHQLFLFVKKE